MSNEYDYLFKLLLIGDSSVGKSCLLLRFAAWRHDVIALFIARAVVDDILPPAFITRARKMLAEASKGFQVLQTAEKSYLSAPHHAELVERRWGGSTHLTVDEVKKKISDLLREYVESGDASEACRCIRQLGSVY